MGDILATEANLLGMIKEVKNLENAVFNVYTSVSIKKSHHIKQAVHVLSNMPCLINLYILYIIFESHKTRVCPACLILMLL